MQHTLTTSFETNPRIKLQGQILKKVARNSKVKLFGQTLK